MTEEARRGWRTVVHAIGAVAMLGMLAWIILMPPSAGTVALIALGLISILLVRELGHAAENVTARIKFSATPTGITGEVG